MSKQHLLLKALRGESVSRPPVWMMRQAGRYLPEYMKLRKKYDFFTRVQTPELACEITLQPVDIVGVDAAILFSDILVIPQAMGMEVQLVPGIGPLLPDPLTDKKSVDKLIVREAADELQYVYDAVKTTKEALNDRVPLIGFAGAPFTLLCYMVEGQGSKTFSKAKRFCFSQPELAHALLAKITTATIDYVKRKIEAGADVIQIFDSWSGLLSPADFATFAQPYLEKIAEEVAPKAPVILFPKGSWYALKNLAASRASALGIDWQTAPETARAFTGGNLTLQGNFDPAKLHMPIPDIQRETRAMIKAFGVQRYIANLGHGITPGVPVDHVRAFVDAVKTYSN